FASRFFPLGSGYTHLINTISLRRSTYFDIRFRGSAHQHTEVTLGKHVSRARAPDVSMFVGTCDCRDRGRVFRYRVPRLRNHRYLDRHVVPSFFLPRQWYVLMETAGRLIIAAIGACLVTVVRSRAGHFASRTPARALHIVIATVLALAASNITLRRLHLRPAE